MPKLYVYLGINIFFYSNDHDPVHVHAAYQEFETKVILRVHDGQITVEYDTIRGVKPLPPHKLDDLKKFIDKYKGAIVERWNDVFLLNKKPKVVTLQRRIK